MPSLVQLLVRRFVDEPAGLNVIGALAALPVACYLTVNGWSLRRAAAEPLDEAAVNAIFKFLGLTTFAALLPLGLLLFKTARPVTTMHDLAVVGSLLGVVPLSVGLFLWQRLVGAALVNLRTAGTSVAVFGALVSLGGLALAWPEPIAMLPAAAVEFAVFTFVAWRFALPTAHLLAAACLTAGYLLGVQLAEQHIDWSGQDPRLLADAIVSGQSGALLAPLVLAYAAATYVLLRVDDRGPRREAAAPTSIADVLASSGGVLACVSCALAAISVALVSGFGFGVEGDPIGAAWVYLLYAAGAIAIAARDGGARQGVARYRGAAVAWVAAGLLFAAVVQGVVFRYSAPLDLAEPEVTAILLYCTLVAAIATIVRLARATTDASPLVEVFWNAAFFSSVAGAAWLVWIVNSTGAALEAGCWLWLAAIWLIVAFSTGWPAVWTLAEIALALATVFGVATQLETRAWFADSPRPWLDPWTWQAEGIALAALSLVAAAVRMACGRLQTGRPPGSRFAHATELLATPWLAVDRAIAGGLAALVVAIGTYAAVPGVLQEISPRQAGMTASGPAAADAALTAPTRVVPPIENFELTDIPHIHAGGWGSWLLLAGVLVLMAAIARQEASRAWLLVLLIAASAALPLMASRWEADVAVASATRWLSAGLLLCASVPIWRREWIARQIARLGWKPIRTTGDFVPSVREMVFFLGLAPPIAIALGIGVMALDRSPHVGRLWDESYALAILCGVAVIVGTVFWFTSQRAFEPGRGGAAPSWPRAVTALVLVLGTAPVLSMFLYHVGMALRDSPILGPEPGSIFGQMGLAASYAVPILITALALIGYALCERSSAYALAGQLVLNAGATAAYLLTISSGALIFDASQWIRLAQLNAGVAACYALAWLGVLIAARRNRKEQGPIAGDFLFNTAAALAPALLGLALGWAWCHLVWNPAGDLATPHVMNDELADAWGWLSLALAAAISLAVAWVAGRRLGMAGRSAGLTALAIIAAAVASQWDMGNWLAYNTLLVGHAVIAMVLLATIWYQRREEISRTAAGAPLRSLLESQSWVSLQRAVLFVLAVRESFDNLWWTAGGFAALAVTAAAAAWIFQRRRYLYDAAIMVNVAGSLAWIEAPFKSGPENLFYVNVILLAAPVALWLMIELLGIRPRQFQPRVNGAPFHSVATRLAIGLLALTVAEGLFVDANRIPSFTSAVDPWLPWVALAVTSFAALACLWDAAAGDSIARLYLLGLVAVGMLLDSFDLSPPWLLWTGNMVVAAYALATSYLWSRRRGLLAIADRLGIPRGTELEFSGLSWLVPCNLLLACAIVALTGFVELTERVPSLRVSAAQAALAQVVSVALLARGDRRGLLQSIALSLGAVGAVMFGWAWLDPETNGTLLHSLVVMAAALAAVATLYGFGLGKLLREPSDWLAPARALTPWLAGLCAASIGGILWDEIFQFAEFGEVEIAWLAIVVVGVTLGGLSVAALATAILPGRDPLGLSPRGRTLYVYAAEVVLALLFVHVRLTVPWLFGGLFQQYWPLVVMAIAFSGVGFSEFCRRRRQDVLAEPIENTGALLPVLPVLGFWAADTRVDYSLLLLSVGVLYAGLSIARRSFGFGVLAALAANGGLWYFLNRQEGLAFLSHPQIWLIPPALCVLAAAYLNRDQLSETQMTALRYFTSMTVYLSSTGDIFINGVAQNPWLPLVLAGLSILGILAGIALRVRAFLFLGTSFLGLALFTIIWHAAVDLEQTWVWAASVIVAGLLIVALFAMFEMKRQKMLAMFEKLKQWEG